jgi:hypothetical protein
VVEGGLAIQRVVFMMVKVQSGITGIKHCPHLFAGKVSRKGFSNDYPDRISY